MSARDAERRCARRRAPVERHGNRWAQIGPLMQRSPSSARSRFQRVRPREAAWADASRANRYRLCGEPRRGHVCVALEPPHRRKEAANRGGGRGVREAADRESLELVKWAFREGIADCVGECLTLRGC